MAKRHEKVEAGSGDAFVDLGFADAGERKLRVKLAMQINELIAARRLPQAAVAVLFGVSQPHVSDVEIIIRPKAKGRAEGHLRVSVA